MFQAFLDKTFHLKKHGTTLRTELIAGVTTFSTMAYIIFVNPSILSQAGMDFSSVMVATIIASFLATFIMGYFANYPFALAPGMGLNAYFTYGLVLGEGYSWQTALGICFIAGLLFLLLTVSGVRQKIMEVIPTSLRCASACGIGIFLAFIGLKNVEIITHHPSTLVTLGNTARIEVLLTALGVIVIATLMTRGISSAILIAIFLNWGIGLALGLVQWKGLFGLPPSPIATFGKLAVFDAFQPQFIPIILSFLFVAIFDATGTLLSLADQGGFLDNVGKLPRVKRAITADAVGTLAGAWLGTSTITTFLESSSGIAAGARTGLAAIVVSFLFLLSLFLSPLAMSIPHFATSPALIIVGALMLQQVKKVQWDDPSESIPAFIIIVTTPLTFSIATGIALGFITYPLIKLLTGKFHEVHWLNWIIAGLFALKFVYL